MVRKEGFEPSSLSAHAPQTCAYASSATSAKIVQMVAPLGFEPRQAAPEAAVLPLHNRAENHSSVTRIRFPERFPSLVSASFEINTSFWWGGKSLSSLPFSDTFEIA